MNFAEITVTPTQLYGVFGALVILGGGALLFRKVFDYATKSDLEKLENTIRLELERHSVARHEMRHEVQALNASMIRVETILEQLPGKIRQDR